MSALPPPDDWFAQFMAKYGLFAFILGVILAAWLAEALQRFAR